MQNLPIPKFFNPEIVGQIWPVPYQIRAEQALAWAKTHEIQPARSDRRRCCLLLIDVQNSFCLPEFELFVGGRSGKGAIEDNIRLCQFIYRNLAEITEIIATLDTHFATQIFHPLFWVNQQGEHPIPAATLINYDDIISGVWRVNPALLAEFPDLETYSLHYVQQLTASGKYPLTIWPYHAMLGSIGHALVPAVEEALFFHNLARTSQTRLEIKGNHPLTENYSVLSPEVLENHQGQAIATSNTQLLQHLLTFDQIVIAGQAKSHCVAWTVADLLTEMVKIDPLLPQKVYLLEDCTSPVVVKGVVDYTESADQAFQEFAAAGMHLINSKVSLTS